MEENEYRSHAVFLIFTLITKILGGFLVFHHLLIRLHSMYAVAFRDWLVDTVLGWRKLQKSTENLSRCLAKLCDSEAVLVYVYLTYCGNPTPGEYKSDKNLLAWELMLSDVFNLKVEEMTF